MIAEAVIEPADVQGDHPAQPEPEHAPSVVGSVDVGQGAVGECARQAHLAASRQALADGATHLGEQRVLLRARKLEGHLAPGDDLVSEPEQHVVVQPPGEAQCQLHVRRSDQPLMGRTEVAQFSVDDRDPRRLVRAA